MKAKLMKENTFDIDCGYITKSPCRSCSMKTSLPECSDSCQIIIQLQALLVGSISCSSTNSEWEEYTILIQN